MATPRPSRIALGAALGLGTVVVLGAATAVKAPARAKGGAQGTLHCPYGAGDAGDVTDGSTDLAYGKQCDTDSDCAIGKHLLDCCGTTVELGIQKRDLPRFSGILDVCGGWATCHCMSRGVFAEDGRRGRDGRHYPPHDISVACTNGECVTRVVDGWKDTDPVPPSAPNPPTTPAPPRKSLADKVRTFLRGDWLCPQPSPSDCRFPAPCKPSQCSCRGRTWYCTPDCNGCGQIRVEPVRQRSVLVP